MAIHRLSPAVLLSLIRMLQKQIRSWSGCAESNWMRNLSRNYFSWKPRSLGQVWQDSIRRLRLWLECRSTWKNMMLVSVLIH